MLLLLVLMYGGLGALRALQGWRERLQRGVLLHACDCVFLGDTLHHVESLEILFDGPQQVGAALADADAVTVAEDVVDDGRHALFAWQRRRAVEFRQKQQHCVILLIRRAVPGPRREAGKRVESGANFERGERSGEEHVAEAVL